MTDQLISTRHVARMLGCSEATVKRWADSHLLPTIRTPGGHRKFLLRDIVMYASKAGRLSPQGETEIDEDVEKVVSALLVGDAARVVAAVAAARRVEDSMAEIGDTLILPAVRQIRQAIAEARCDPFHEHLVRDTVMAVWVLMRPWFVLPRPPRSLALLAPSPGEPSDVITRLAALVAVENGLLPFPMGSGMSADALADAASSLQAAWIVLGSETPQNGGAPAWQQSSWEHVKPLTCVIWLGETAPPMGQLPRGAIHARDLSDLQHCWRAP